MSTKKGNNTKQGQKHQNTFAFKHNKNSRLTRKIQEAPLDLLCEHCLQVLQWKIKYRKYRPLSTPGKCNLCELKNILKGHRMICDQCSKQHMLCSKCLNPCENFAKPSHISKHLRKTKKVSTFEEVVEFLKERQRRTVNRKIEQGEKVIYDEKRGLILKRSDTVLYTLEEIGINEKGEMDVEEEENESEGIEELEGEDEELKSGENIEIKEKLKKEIEEVINKELKNSKKLKHLKEDNFLNELKEKIEVELDLNKGPEVTEENH